VVIVVVREEERGERKSRGRRGGEGEISAATITTAP